MTGVTRTDMVAALPEELVARISAPIPLRRIGYSLLTVLISGQLIGLVQRLPLPWDKPRPEAAE